MPKRRDIEKIMIIGAGPIVIGQACEFDYSGTQACKALKEEGYKVVLLNSNPATIMTDPEMAYRTYIEPITPQIVEKIIDRERPQAILTTMGGQTALNTSVVVAEAGILNKYGVELIGANFEAIKKALWKYPFLKIIAVTNYSHNTHLRELILSGFKGCVLKDRVYEDLENAIFNVKNGNIHFNDKIIF